MDFNAKEFNIVCRDIFAPIYPVIAADIIETTKIREGICLDIGAGPGYLGLALKELASDLKVILYDMSDEMLEVAQNNILSRNIVGPIEAQKGKVEKLPYNENTIDLIVSRGSIFFWDDQCTGLNEIYRVLKLGGCAYIGGGFGNKQLLDQIQKKMVEKDPDWNKARKRRIESTGYGHFEELMKKTNIPDYKINRKEAGLWIMFRK